MDLVGREDTLDTFGQVLRSVADGASAGLRLAGEPGIGKSRLLAELAGQARSLGFQVLSGRASEFERDAPFMIFVDALDDHVAGLGPKLTRALPAAATELLSAVFPAIPAPSGASAQRVGAERYRIYRAVRTLLDELAKTSPVALLLDDLHWADDSSAELFAHLLTYPPPERVLIATAYRPSQLGERPRSAVERALREERLTAIDIGPLSRTEARLLLGRGSGGNALDALYTESGGNPFYLLELAREQRPLDGHGGWHGSGVPAAVVAAINVEIAGLPDDARQLAQGAAVAGETFTASAAATAADVDVATAPPLVDRLVADGLLVPSEVPQRFRFRHPVVRRAVYDSAGASRRVVMHRRLATDLRARDASPVELAHHLEVAAEQGDQAAIDLLAAAGHELAGTAPAIAAKRFAAALRLLRPGDNARWVELLIPLAAARRAGGELRASRDALVEALSCVPADAVADRVRLTALCGAVETDLGLISEAHTRLRRAWDAMPERTSILAAELLIELAINAYHRRDWAGQVSYAGDALAAARRLCARQIEAMALTMHALAEFGEGRFERAQAALDQAAQVVDALTDRELAARLDVTAVLSLCEFFLERFEAAVRHADRGLALSRSTGQTQSFHAHLQARVVPLGLLGRLDEALEGAREAEASARLIGVDQVLLTALTGVVHGSLAVGDLPAAISAGEEGLALARSLPPTELAAVLAWGTALALLESGQLGRAAVVLFDGPAASAMTPNANCCVWGLAARIEAERGRFDQAWRWVDRLDARRDQLAGLRFPRYWAERARAQVLLRQGDAASAARSALAAVAVNPSSPYEASEARLLAGRALAAAGERAEAVAQLQQARSEFEEYGAVRHRDEAVRELRRLGERVGRGGRRTTGDVGAAALSDRERQIAEMVSDGRTNKEIGDALLISTRTVERHLSHVFDKLSVSSRAQLGAEFQRLRS